MIWIISDVHGCIKTLKALIKKIKEKDPKPRIHFVGDLIDRGPGSVEVLEFIKKKKYKFVRGNHEAMAYESVKDHYMEKMWNENGGGYRVSEELMEFMKTAPLYLHYPKLKDENGRSLFISHTLYHHPEIKVEGEQAEQSLLWNRRFNRESEFSFNEKPVFCVFGHTPFSEPIVTKAFAAIDTGCVYYGQAEGAGNLTAICFPSKEIIQQEYCEDNKEELKRLHKKEEKKDDYVEEYLPKNPDQD